MAIVQHSEGTHKTLSETPPPTYEEALYRQSARLPVTEEQADHAEQEERMEADLDREEQQDTAVEEISSDPNDELQIVQSSEVVQGAQAAAPDNKVLGDCVENTKAERNMNISEVIDNNDDNLEMQESEKISENIEDSNPSNDESCDTVETRNVLNV